jgi:hypothetical protein
MLVAASLLACAVAPAAGQTTVGAGLAFSDRRPTGIGLRSAFGVGFRLHR